MMFLKKVDRIQFEGRRTHLHNQYSIGLLQYPQDPAAAAYVMITSHRPTVTPTPTRTETSGLIFLHTRTHQINNGKGQRAPQEQRSTIVGTDGKLHASLMCYTCNGFGDYTSHCPGEAPATTMGVGFL